MAEFFVKVENVVAFTSLGKDIPLTRLVTRIENAEYEPEQFPGLVYRTNEPRAAALIFSSGKIVCTGAKSIDMAKIAMKKVVDRVRQTGVPLPTKFHVQVENIVASSKIKANLNLEEIAFSLENAEYEPEQFPGLVYRINDPRVAFLLFSSGKIICTGAHNIDDIHNALSKLKKKLEEIGIKVTPVKDGPNGDVPVNEEIPEHGKKEAVSPSSARVAKPAAKPTVKPVTKPEKAKPKPKPEPKTKAKPAKEGRRNTRKKSALPTSSQRSPSVRKKGRK